jgi:hypothetical protein
MPDRHSIDAIRNSALQMEVGTPDDPSAVKDMCVIRGSMHVIKGQGIYRIQLADNIDPKRTNTTIPNTQQRVLSYGTDCDFVRQTLMTAKRLFDAKFLGQSFNQSQAIDLTFDALKDIASMHTMRLEMDSNLQKIEASLGRLAMKNRSMSVPSVGEARGLAETFLQKADHATVDLFEISKLFYGDAVGKKWFESLLKLVKEKYGDDVPFAKFLEQVLPFLKFVRNARNCMEHPKADQYVEVSDIALSATGQLQPPSIAVVHPETPQPPVNLGELMAYTVKQLGDVFELMIALLCACNVQPFAGMPIQVVQYQPEQQKGFGVRYGYGSIQGDIVIPCG